MIPKTEPAEHIPKSTSPLSMDTIVRDLRSLEKSLISSRERSQNQLNIMHTKVNRLEFENSKSQAELEDKKSKIKLLEEQNLKLKSDLEASELDKILASRRSREAMINISKLEKEVHELKIENESLKTEMILFKSSKLANRSSNLISLTDSDNDENDVTNFGDVVDDAPDWTRSKLSGNDQTSDGASNDEPHENTKDQKSPRQQKRKSRSESESENIPKSKKPCPMPTSLVFSSWNCIICSEPSKFNTKSQLQDHIKQQHPLRAWFCERCPFTASKKSGLTKHQKLHTTNELQFKDTENANKCNLCNVWFPPGSALTNHYKLYHCSNKDGVRDEKGTTDLGTSSNGQTSEDESADDLSVLCDLDERRGNVIDEILEARFWPRMAYHYNDNYPYYGHIQKGIY